MAAEPSHESLYLEHYELVERLLRVAARRHGLRDDEADDFAGCVRLRLVESDYEIFRKFRGESSLDSYLITVFAHLAKDWLIARRGKWRPSAKARHLGVDAVRLERLLSYDRRDVADAVEILLRNYGSRASRDELLQLAAELPHHPVRTEVADAALAHHVDGSDTAQTVLDAEEHEQALAVTTVVTDTLAGLDAEDRVLLDLRYRLCHTVASIARTLGLDQRRLYSRYDRLLRRLRRSLTSAGVDWRQLAECRGWSGLDWPQEVADMPPDAENPPIGPSQVGGGDPGGEEE